MKYYILAIKNYVVVEGRTTRKEYWMFVLFNILFSIAAKLLDWAMGTNHMVLGDSGLVDTLYGLFIMIPGITAQVRRLHDVGKSGWWLLRWVVITVVITLMFFVYAIVVAGAGMVFSNTEAIKSVGILALPFFLYILGAVIWLLVLLVKPSMPGPNKYGPDPNGPLPPYEGAPEVISATE